MITFTHCVTQQKKSHWDPFPKMKCAAASIRWWSKTLQFGNNWVDIRCNGHHKEIQKPTFRAVSPFVKANNKKISKPSQFYLHCTIPILVTFIFCWCSRIIFYFFLMLHGQLFYSVNFFMQFIFLDIKALRHRFCNHKNPPLIATKSYSSTPSNLINESAQFAKLHSHKNSCNAVNELIKMSLLNIFINNN